MDTGIYVAMSKELGILRDMDTTANNLANVDTTGFNGADLLFKDYLADGTAKEGKVAYADDYTTYRDTSQGQLRLTNNPLDAAIEGNGYFTVKTLLGIRYTRNGSFRINGSGILVTAEGYHVLDSANQDILFDPADKVIQIRDDGTINVDNADRALLNIVQFDNPQLMERAGDSYYKSDAKPRPAENFTVAGGMLEASNVKPVIALTHMMYVSRSINDTATYMSTIDTLIRKASDTLAKVYS